MWCMHTCVHTCMRLPIRTGAHTDTYTHKYPLTHLCMGVTVPGCLCTRCVEPGTCTGSSDGLEATLAEGKVHVRTMVEALGGLCFAAAVLEYLRPFLVPLYTWTAAVPPAAAFKPPVIAKLVLSHLHDRLKSGDRLVKCLPLKSFEVVLFRTDASATETRPRPTIKATPMPQQSSTAPNTP